MEIVSKQGASSLPDWLHGCLSDSVQGFEASANWVAGGAKYMRLSRASAEDQMILILMPDAHLNLMTASPLTYQQCRCTTADTTHESMANVEAIWSAH